MEDFPLPLPPLIVSDARTEKDQAHTSAIRSPLSIFKFRPSRTLTSGRDGYANWTPRSSIVPLLSRGTGSPIESGTGDLRECKPMIRCEAPTPFIKPVKKLAKAGIS